MYRNLRAEVANTSRPAARWMAPSTPPPPNICKHEKQRVDKSVVSKYNISPQIAFGFGAPAWELLLLQAKKITQQGRRRHAQTHEISGDRAWFVILLYSTLVKATGGGMLPDFNAA